MWWKRGAAELSSVASRPSWTTQQCAKLPHVLEHFCRFKSRFNHCLGVRLVCWVRRGGTIISSYLSNHVQLNKINNRAHNSYTAGLAATVRLSVCLTTGAIRTSLHYQGITLNTAGVACAVPGAGRRPQQCREGGGRGCKLTNTISLLPLDTHIVF